MNTYVTALLCTAISASVSSISAADSLRCKSKLVQVGDTKAEVIDKCGDPVMTDNFCEPVVVNTQPQGIQNGNNNLQNNTAITRCENIDIWTYHPGKGRFMTHLYFSQGKLQSIGYGDRVK